MSKDATIMRFEPCPDCSDGSCRACGPASSEHAAPGIRLVVRHVRFVRCCAKGCAACGANAHPLAAPGVKVEVVEEHDAKRWIPVVHMRKGDKAACGTSHASDEHLTEKRSEVTCARCKKWK